MTMQQYYLTSIEQADKYLKAAMGGLNREAVFTPEILYNILGMAIEQYSMAFLHHNESMPDNHTFLDLVEAMSRVASFPKELGEELRTLQGYQEICCLDSYQRNAPDRAIILGMIETARKLESFVRSSCE